MTDAELAAALWSIYQRYVGSLNTAETRLLFRADVHAVLGPDRLDPNWDDYQHLICDLTNNPPDVVARGDLGFDFAFKRDGKKFVLSGSDLNRFNRIGLL
jgi:hypothetical protein